jgi:hypothetical protein
MAVTSAQIVDFLLANPGMTDAQIVAAMEQYGVSPAQMAQAVGLDEGAVAARVAATVAPGSTITLGDTIVQPVYQTTGSGENQQVGGIENVITYKTGENQVGGGYQQYTPTGELERTGTQQAVSNSLTPFILGSLGLFGGLGGGFESLFGGAGTTAGTIGSDLAGLSGIPAGTGALTAAESAALYGTGGLTTGALTAGGASTLGAGSSLGTGLTTAGAGGLGGATGAAGLGGSLGAGLTTAGAGGLGGAAGAAGLGGSLGAGLTTAGGLVAGNTLLGGAGLGTTLAGLGTGVGGSLLGSTVGSTLGSTVGSTLGSTLGTAAATGLGGLTAAQLGALLSSGLTLGGGLLQSQTSKDAAIKAQQMIDTETLAAKQAAAFRPIGMTTRFGTSKFGVDPTTGLPTASYSLSDEAKAIQKRLDVLQEAGLKQAEGAQEQFKPLQTGATSLFTLGNKYLAQTPETVASDYMKSQLALLAPGREQELAFLQNKLQQQGRGGLSVAQGGNLGATTPELQAYMNAKIQEDARLAANAQQYGQQNVLFGAGLLGQGSQAMGQYYGGQQAAYTPYSTALGQIQGLEQLGQQPLSLSTNIGQQYAQAGANVGKLGLVGAGQSVDLATGQAATNNPYAQILAGLGASPTLGAAAGSYLGGLFS